MPSIDQEKRDGAPRGGTYWRSLDELRDTPEFRQLVENEFPQAAEALVGPATRRTFLKLMGASFALAGMTACRWPKEEILPFASRPEGRIPGVPESYATAMEVAGVGVGLLVTSMDGRPIKVEGNPDHPAGRGASSAWAQAAILEMYDPDRSSRVVKRDGGEPSPSNWAEFEAFIASQSLASGAGLRVLSGSIASPAVRHAASRMAAKYPNAVWHEYDAISRENELRGSEIAFGSRKRVHVDLSGARAIVSLGSDFLATHPDWVRLAGAFADHRSADQGEMSRLHVFESGYSLTGAMADARHAAPPSKIGAMAADLAALLFGKMGLALPSGAAEIADRLGDAGAVPAASQAVERAAEDLMKHRGASVVMVGAEQPSAVHALAHVINEALGNAGRTVSYTPEPAPIAGGEGTSLSELTAAMEAGEVDTLLILGGNPVFDAPADLNFGDKLSKVATTIRLGLYEDETSQLCDWHLPEAHFLEAWGDTRSWDGTYSVVQPLIQPLLGGKSTVEVLAMLLGEDADGYTLTKASFAETTGAGNWRKSLHDGLVEGSSWRQSAGRVSVDGLGAALDALHAAASSSSGIELLFAQDASVYDGRFANNGWLQEMPDPMTKIAWDNVATLSPATAAEVGVRDESLVKIDYEGRSIVMPVYVLPGMADGTVVVGLGYGRTHAGRVGDGVGVDTYVLRGASSPWGGPGAKLEATGATYPLACTQDFHAIDTGGFNERERRVQTLVREASLDHYKEHPDFAQHMGLHVPDVDLWEPLEYSGNRWGMTIDLARCIGCSACVVACNAENNIPVVGKDEVRKSREMHWIRIDRYFSGAAEAPEVVFQPVACHHCETAPCEQVCPVAATVHGEDGLNQMVYNRCIGTRYCSNNCPFKVRRFNFWNNHKDITELEKLHFNPDVTVRSRGVMEKCTYCIQRIQRVKIHAKNEQRPIRDGEVATACEQVCPTRAIVFGDLRDESSRVHATNAQPRAYTILEELKLQPRTMYLARIRNPVPGSSGEREGHGDGQSTDGKHASQEHA